MVISPQFDMTYGFAEGLAAVRIGELKTGKFGYIDKQGHMVINPQFKTASDFAEGLAAISIGHDFAEGLKHGFGRQITYKYGYIEK